MDPHRRVAGRQQFEIVRVVGEDQTASEADGGGHHEGVDGHVAATTGIGQKMPGMPGDADPGGDDPGEALGEDVVDGLVKTAAPVQLDEHGGRDAHLLAPPIRRTQRTTDRPMSGRIDVRMGERRESFGVQDQGHNAS